MVVAVVGVVVVVLVVMCALGFLVILGLYWSMLAHLGAMLAHLGAMLAHLGAMLAILRPMLPITTHLEPQDPKNANSEKHRKTREFLRSAAGAAAPLSFGEERRPTAMPRLALGPVGPWPDALTRDSWPGAHVEVIGVELLWLLRLSVLFVVVVLVVVCGYGLGFLVCVSWFVVNGLGLYGPILGLCWPILKTIWAHLRAMLAHLGAMLAHLEGNLGPFWGYVGPSWGLCCPIWTHFEALDPKNGKNGSSK